VHPTVKTRLPHRSADVLAAEREPAGQPPEGALRLRQAAGLLVLPLTLVRRNRRQM